MGSLQTNIANVQKMIGPFTGLFEGMEPDQIYGFDQTRLHGLSKAYEVLSPFLFSSLQRNTNSTATYDYEQLEYVGKLEKDNLSLSCRIAELEKENASMKEFVRHMKPLEVYVPTIIRLIEEHSSAYENVAGKISYLRSRHPFQEAEFELWGGAKKAIDISTKTLDEILEEIE